MTKANVKVLYRIVSDHAGVSWGRASSPFDRFGDANREAMRVCAEKTKRVRVYAITDRAAAGDLVAEYAPVNGRAECVPVV